MESTTVSNSRQESSPLTSGKSTSPRRNSTTTQTSEWAAAADKTFEKLVTTTGAGLKCPREGSVCVVRMIPLSISALPAETIVLEKDVDLDRFIDERSLYFRDARDFKSQEVVVGESETEFDSMIDKILESMKPGECAQVKFRIYANEQLVLDSRNNKTTSSEIKLVNIQLELQLLDCTLVDEVWQMKPEHLLALSQHHKDRGVMWYKEENYVYALRRFTKAIRLLLVCRHLLEPLSSTNGGASINVIKKAEITWAGDSTPSDNADLKQQVDKLCSSVYGNIAAIQVHKMPNNAKNCAAAVSNCTKALDCDDSNIKALCRRGIAYKNMQEFALAKRDFCQVLKKEPDNVEVRKELQKLDITTKKEPGTMSSNLRKAFS